MGGRVPAVTRLSFTSGVRPTASATDGSAVRWASQRIVMEPRIVPSVRRTSERLHDELVRVRTREQSQVVAGRHAGPPAAGRGRMAQIRIAEQLDEPGAVRAEVVLRAMQAEGVDDRHVAEAGADEDGVVAGRV